MGIDPPEVPEHYLSDRLAVCDCRLQIDYDVLQDSLEGVPDGKHAEPALPGRCREVHRINVPDDAVKVPLREHYSLGLSGGTGGEDDGCKIILSKFVYAL